MPNIDSVSSDEVTEKAIDKLIRKIRLEVHYAINQYFLEENHLLNNIDKIQDPPTTIIHGRRDITCPVESSWLIHNALTRSSLHILPDAGTLSEEADMIEALVAASDDVIELLEKQ